MTGIDTAANETPKGPEPGGSILEENLKARSTWTRLLFMLVFVVLSAITEVVLCAVVVIQFVWRIAKGEPNEQLLELGQGLATYLFQIVRFLTFNTEELPFPFDGDWPSKEDKE